MKKKIMIVDDEEDMVELIKAVLQRAGFDVICTYSGQECLDKLKKVKPDLILMDLMMPGITGRQTVQRIRKNPKTKNLKIAFLTVARMSELGRKELQKLKTLDYITKPFESDDLVKRIKKIVEVEK